MPRFASTIAAAVVLLTAATVDAQWPPESFTNLKVFPKDISLRELTAEMRGYTRALGVRCTHCHVGVEGADLSTYKFAADDKPAKLTARKMIELVRAINTQYLSSLETRAEPPVKVKCVTCHRGTTEPRMLQDVLLREYQTGGLDALTAKYRALRERYYGRSAYDFGEVPLADVATEIWDAGKPDDAVHLHALNVEMNPASAFAKRQHASLGITRSFRQDGIERGTAQYRELRDKYGPTIFTEALLGEIGTRLMNAKQMDLAVAVFRLNVEAFPQSATTHESLVDAYVKSGDTPHAIESYERAIKLDPKNVTAKEKLDKLRPPSGRGGG
jgi:tetratricopeptide (TPR) repeat protein